MLVNGKEGWDVRKLKNAGTFDPAMHISIRTFSRRMQMPDTIDPCPFAAWTARIVPETDQCRLATAIGKDRRDRRCRADRLHKRACDPQYLPRDKRGRELTLYTGR